MIKSLFTKTGKTGWAHFITSCVLALSMALAANTAYAADDGAKVVYHVDFNDPTRYSATLTSINNILNFYDFELMEA